MYKKITFIAVGIAFVCCVVSLVALFLTEKSYERVKQNRCNTHCMLSATHDNCKKWEVTECLENGISCLMGECEEVNKELKFWCQGYCEAMCENCEIINMICDPPGYLSCSCDCDI